MATRAYWLSPQAESDLEDIWLYSLRNWSLAQADRYHRTLIIEIEALAAGTKTGQTSAVRPNYRRRACGSHVIWFRDRGGRLEVIRVLHGAQDAERHLHD